MADWNVNHFITKQSVDHCNRNRNRSTPKARTKIIKIHKDPTLWFCTPKVDAEADRSVMNWLLFLPLPKFSEHDLYLRFTFSLATLVLVDTISEEGCLSNDFSSTSTSSSPPCPSSSSPSLSLMRSLETDCFFNQSHVSMKYTRTWYTKHIIPAKLCCITFSLFSLAWDKCFSIVMTIPYCFLSWNEAKACEVDVQDGRAHG